jgi:hypothetical protein
VGAAKASRSGSRVVSVYIPADLWDWLRRHAFEHETSASATIVARVEQLRDATPDEQAATVVRAREITIGRRRRTEREDGGG